MKEIEIVNVSDDCMIPAYQTEHSAGMDLYYAGKEPVTLKPFERFCFPTGIKIALPEGYEAQVRPRSGLAVKYGITILNAPGTIDADYRGEIHAPLINLDPNNAYTIKPGERIAQLVIAKYEKVNWKLVETLDETERGEGRFGSTGK